MEKVYKLGGLDTFSIGVVLLAGTSFLVCLDMGLVLALIYRLINTLALCIMAIGIFSLTNYNGSFAESKILIILDIIVTIVAAGLIPFGYRGGYPALDYVSLFCSVAGVALSIGAIFLVIKGCGEIAAEKGDEEHQASCEKSGKLFLILTILGFAALAGVIALGDALSGLSLFVIIFGGILIVGAHIIMMLRAHETAKRFHQENRI